MLNIEAHDSMNALRDSDNLSRLPSLQWQRSAPGRTMQDLVQHAGMLPRRSMLANRILTTLIDHAQKPLLGDDLKVYTGRECLDLVLKLSHEIRDVSPFGGRVAILFPPGTAQAISILSAIFAGRVPVVLNHWTDKTELHRLVAVNHIHALIVGSQGASDQVPPTGQIELTDDLAIAKTTRVNAFEKPLPPPSTALILYTSGSTGQSKAVLLSESSLVYMIDHLIDRLGLGPETTATVTLPIFHTMALITQFLPTFFAGGQSIIVNTELSTGKLYRLISGSEGTFIALISDMLKYCKEEKEKRGLPAASMVKVVQLAGGHINSTHLSLARELFPNAIIYKGYGLTEGIRVAMISSDDPLFLQDTAGYPLPDQQVSIRDERGVVLPQGEHGEIHVKGPNVMIGYDGDVGSRFTEDGFLATGDFGHLSPEGLVVIKGRKDHVFKSNGRKIAAREVEQVAIERPEVLKARCIPVDCPQKGLRPILLVEIDAQNVDDATINWKNELVGLLKARLDAYKVPKDVIVTTLPQLPNGKIDQTAVSAIWQKKEAFRYLGKATFGCHFHKY